LGPVVVLSYASENLKSYKGSIYRGYGCEEIKDPNHTSLLYGYNFNTPLPYLMFKNNWGKNWGENGYYKMEIGELSDENMGLCMIANTPFNVMPIV
jgi:C1A family cysteine protease